MPKGALQYTTGDLETHARCQSCAWPLIRVLPVLLLLASGCKKTESAAPGSATPVAAVPAFSAAQTIGMFVYPKNNQTHNQQLIDESACYNSVQQETGINPQAAAPQAPSSAALNAAEQQGAADATQAEGGRVRGAARGAAGGALVGAITGHAGRGAAIGATVGTVRGGRRQRRANEEAQQEGAQTAASQEERAYGQSKAAYNRQMGTFKRGFTACMSARSYSVS